MAELLANIWPVHVIAWIVCGFIGVILGALLANATERLFVNLLILSGIIASTSFALAQAIAMAVELRPEDVSSFSDFGTFWLNYNDSNWISGHLSSQVWLSTAVGLGLSLICGVAMLWLRKARELT